MKGKAAGVSRRETRFLPAGSLPALHLIAAGKVTLGAGHGGSRSMGWSLPSRALMRAPALEGWLWSLGSILLDFAWRWQMAPAGAGGPRGIQQGWRGERGLDWKGRGSTLTCAISHLVFDYWRQSPTKINNPDHNRHVTRPKASVPWQGGAWRK